MKATEMNIEELKEAFYGECDRCEKMADHTRKEAEQKLFAMLGILDSMDAVEACSVLGVCMDDTADRLQIPLSDLMDMMKKFSVDIAMDMGPMKHTPIKVTIKEVCHDQDGE